MRAASHVNNWYIVISWEPHVTIVDDAQRIPHCPSRYQAIARAVASTLWTDERIEAFLELADPKPGGECSVVWRPSSVACGYRRRWCVASVVGGVWRPSSLVCGVRRRALHSRFGEEFDGYSSPTGFVLRSVLTCHETNGLIERTFVFQSLLDCAFDGLARVRLSHLHRRFHRECVIVREGYDVIGAFSKLHRIRFDISYSPAPFREFLGPVKIIPISSAERANGSV